ncbi:hypothetical protein [Streptomyces europaeiscabiei]|uniref:hypothetical protein n=1 Tax=Streptomyces europaeiscabiei TaxID=146819 RepID=UPI002E25AF18|nr:hypothetical protein OG858_47660 [Streptomyces europaeiscabiei]
MTGRAWPSREEWQAKAEYAVRTACTKWQRLDRLQPDTVWSSLAEDHEFEDLARPAAAQIRSLLTAEIGRLRALLPDRPKEGSARNAWFVALEGQAYEDACNLGALEEMRRDVERARRKQHWGTVCWELGRIRDHYSAITLPGDLVKAHDRMLELQAAMEKRRDDAADAVQQAAIDREIARRATDEAWAQELEHRAAIDHPRVIRVGQTSPSKGDQVT